MSTTRSSYFVIHFIHRLKNHMKTPASSTILAPTKLGKKKKACFQVLSRFFTCNTGLCFFISQFMFSQVYIPALNPSNPERFVIFETYLQMLVMNLATRIVFMSCTCPVLPVNTSIIIFTIHLKIKLLKFISQILY